MINNIKANISSNVGNKTISLGGVSGWNNQRIKNNAPILSKKDDIQLVSIDGDGGTSTDTGTNTNITEVNIEEPESDAVTNSSDTPILEEKENKGKKFLKTAINGVGLSFIALGKDIAKVNPAVGGTLIAAGMAGTLTADDGNIGSNAIYGGLSVTPIEDRIASLLKYNSKFNYGGISLVGDVGWGSLALFAMNGLTQIIGGAKPKEVLATSPQTLLESTVWTVTGTCVESVLTPFVGPAVGKIAGQTCASIATSACTKPFTDENGNVSQKWCLVGEAGIVGGIAGGAGLLSTGVIAATPPGLVILGCAAVGYGLVTEAKYKYDSVMNGTSTDPTYEDYLRKLTTPSSGPGYSSYDDYLKGLYSNNNMY